MKKLTLDLYERIIDVTHVKSRDNFRLLGHITKPECAEYLAFYGLRNGLFWSEQDGCIAGVATAHPGNHDFEWDWKPDEGIWTAHMVWAQNKSALHELIQQFFVTRPNPVSEFYAWRNGKPRLLTSKKLERTLIYGRK